MDENKKDFKDPKDTTDEVVEVATPTPITVKADKANVIRPISAVVAVETPRKLIDGNGDVTVGDFAGGSAGLVDAGRTPIGGRDRQGSREQRIRALDVSKINAVISERAIPEFLEDKDITEGGVQGTRRRKRDNKLALSRKNLAQASPVSDSFHKSIDVFMKDKFLSSQGLIFNDDALTDVYPQLTEATPGVAVAVGTTTKRSNYQVKSVTITANANGPDMTINAEELDVNTAGLSTNIIDASFVTGKPKINEVENARLSIIDNAADEASVTWSPLGKGILKPSRQLALYADLEASAGSIVAAAAKSTQQSLAFQLNLLAKDGNISNGPLGRHMNGSWDADYSAYNPDTDNEQLSLRRIISFYDSPAKYNTKGDVLSQRRSLHMPVEIGAKLTDQFMIRPEFKKYLDAASALGSLDGGYSSDQPVAGIQNAYLIDHINPNQISTYANGSITRNLFYAYSEERNNYRMDHGHDVFDGIFKFITKNWGKFSSAFNLGSNADSITIPVKYDMQFGNTWSYLVMMAMNDIVQSRQDTKYDILNYEANFVYPFTWLKPLKDFPVMNSKYVGFTSVFRSLEIKELPIEMRLDFLAPESMPLIMEDLDVAQYSNHHMMPWYFNAGSFTVDVDGNLDWDQSMNWPKIRKGFNAGILMDLFEFGAEEYRKTFDIMTAIPGFANITSAGDIGAFNTGDDAATVVYRYDTVLTVKELITTPRALGFMFDVPSGYNVVTTNLDDEATGLGNLGAVIFFTDDAIGTQTRGESYHQVYQTIRTGAIDSIVLGWLNTYGIILTDAIDGIVNQTITPYAALAGVDPEFTSLASLFYTLTTKVMFFSNPFNQAAEEDTSADQPFTQHPFEIMTWFGLVGFRKSEFSEDLTLAYTEAVEQGLGYIKAARFYNKNKFLE